MWQSVKAPAGRFLRKTAASILLLFALLLSACSGEVETQGAKLIDDSNRDLIGTTISIQGAPPQPDPDAPQETWETLSDGVTGAASPDVPVPHTLVEFPTKEGVTPEILMENGDCALFSRDEEGGWPCEPGDRLAFTFEKYPSEAVPVQAAYIGYLRDGLAYEGEVFHELAGAYVLEVEEAGNYQIYIISGTSDYFALKEGLITLNP